MVGNSHTWVNRTRGREIVTIDGQRYFRLKCTHLHCTVSRAVSAKKLMPPEVIDKNFKAAGWTIDPSMCPEHSKKEKSVATHSPSQAAMKAQVHMIRLLTDYFYISSGTYVTGCSDKEIAAQTGIAIDAVKQYREAGFGPLKEPEELARIADDIDGLKGLIAETKGQITALETDVVQLSARLTEARKKFAV